MKKANEISSTKIMREVETIPQLSSNYEQQH
jgi:hypothetical protein